MNDGANESGLAFSSENALTPVHISIRRPVPGPEISPVWLTAKGFLDFFGAFFLLIALSPFILAVSLLVASSGKPILFKQTRIGRGGVPFKCYKFRTMVPDAERVLLNLLEKDPAARAEWQRDFKLKNDPRITPIGAFLRKTSLDELPQLFNVLRGEMSLVGPRPIVQNELNRYGRAARWYLAVKPGMTGLWQVSGRNDVSYIRRVALDTYYVRSQRLLLDFGILFLTIRVVFGKRGAY
jgi:UDP-galactose-lipid carrier transferase